MADKKYDLGRKVNIRNTSGIDTYFARIGSGGDQKVAARSVALVSFGEVLDQCHAGNRDFIGTDGRGAHATFVVMDAEVREEAGLGGGGALDEAAVVALFGIEGADAFLAALAERVVTLGEKQTLRDAIGAGAVNAHDKIEMAERFLRGEAPLVPAPEQAPAKKAQKAPAKAAQAGDGGQKGGEGE